MKRKKLNSLLFIIFLTVFLICFFSSNSYASTYPNLIKTLNSAFEKIESWLLKLATPAAAVAVGSGVFIRKFSFGDEEKIRMGKNLIRGSLFSYAFILLIDLILSAISGLLS